MEELRWVIEIKSPCMYKPSDSFVVFLGSNYFIYSKRPTITPETVMTYVWSFTLITRTVGFYLTGPILVISTYISIAKIKL